MLAATPMIAAGAEHRLALKSDGTVVSWGINYSGQLGNYSTVAQADAIVVPGVTRGIALDAGAYHSVVLKSDGTVMTWGRNVDGQLGDGTTIQRTYPIVIPSLTGVIGVAAGQSHTVALMSDGTVMTWGANSRGQLGDGSTSSSSRPKLVPGLSGVVAVVARGEHTLALKSNGTVLGWGYNALGELGDGTAIQRPSPTLIQGLNGVVAIATEYANSMALKSDGTVMAWGNNAPIERSLNPVSVQGLSGIVAIAGGDQRFALKSDGTVMAWGTNNWGQVGDGTEVDRLSPVAVQGLTGVAAVAVSPAYSLALKTDGTVWNIGYLGIIGPSNGYFGNPVPPSSSSLWIAVPGLNLGVSAIPARPVSFGIALKTANRNGIAATITSPPWEIGKAFPVMLGASITGGFYFRGIGLQNWSLYQGGTLPVALQVPAMPSSLPIDVFDVDISTLTGLEVYAAYGDPVVENHLAKLVTIAKRVTLVFPNQGSAVSTVVTTPFGWGFVFRKAQTDGTRVLDVTQPGGTYFQLVKQSSGLPEIRSDGYTLTVLALDSLGQVAQIAFKKPDGTVATIGNAPQAAVRNLAMHRIDPVSICRNPDGTQGLADERRELTYACEVLVDFGHPTIQLLNKGIDMATDAYASLNGVLARMRDGINRAETEIADTGKDTGDRGTGRIPTAAYTYPDSPVLTGTTEDGSKKLLSDARKVSQGQYDFATMNSRTLTAPDGNWANPISCASPYAPIKNECIPVVDSVTPTAVMINQSATFVAKGKDLTNDMEFYFADCSPMASKSVGSSIQQQATCTPTVSGSKAIAWSMARTGSEVFKGNVQVCPSTQIVQNGQCACNVSQEMLNNQCVTKCATNQIRQNGVCTTVVPTCSSSQELVSDQCVPVCAPNQVRLSGLCATTTATGQVSIWTNSTSTINSVYVDSTYVGSLNIYYTSQPSCGASGTITKTLPAGTHSVSATTSGTSWAATNVTISANSCTSFKLGTSTTSVVGGGGGGSDGCYAIGSPDGCCTTPLGVRLCN